MTGVQTCALPICPFLPESVQLQPYRSSVLRILPLMVLGSASRNSTMRGYLFTNPDSTRGDQVRGIIKGGKLNLATSIETQMTRMSRGKNIFPEI